MKRLALLLGVGLLLLLCAVPVEAQPWPMYAWRYFPDTDEEVALMVWTGYGWHQAGAYNYDEDYYQAITGTGWGDRCRPPLTPPARRGVPRRRNFGMDYRPRRGAEAKYIDQDGRELSRQQAVDAVKGKRPPKQQPQKREESRLIGAPVPDDSQKLKATVIDQDKDRRERIKAALQGTGAAVQAYDPQGPDVLSWAVKRYGYALESPQVYVQGPGGKVYSRTPREATAQELTAAVAKAEAMRVQNPQYDASKDPDLTRPFPLAFAGLTPTDLAAGGSGLAAVLAAMMFGRRRGGV